MQASMQTRLRPARRTCFGAMTAETVAVIYVLLFFLLFPLLNLASLGVRYAFVMIAASDAAIQASLSTTFDIPNGTQPSAQTAASTAVTNTLAPLRGIHLTAVTTRILVTNLATDITTRTAAKLSAPANTSNNIYMLEPEVDATIDPLVTIPTGSFKIQGISAPFNVQVYSRKMAENPQGLNL